MVHLCAGCILATPFLSKLGENLCDSELNTLMITATVWTVLSNMLTKIGVGFSFGGWPFTSWFLLYFAGYYLKRIAYGRNLKIIYCAGAIGLALYMLARAYEFDNNDSIISQTLLNCSYSAAFFQCS